MNSRTKFFSAAILAAVWLAGSSAFAQHEGGHTYTNGICTIEGCTDKYQEPALVDGWYQLTNAGNVEWIGDYVQNVAINPNVKMMNDIDFTNVEYRMIGRNSGRKFNGVFDGQGHRITNLTLNYGSADTPNAIGFFGWVRGGSTIKNLIMDASCYFEGKVRVAAFVGVTQVKDAGPVRIENCINEANVKGHTGATGGFIGCRNPENQDTPQAIISSCVNSGDITCDANEAAAFVGWANAASNMHMVENSYNFGNITSDGQKRGFIRGDNLQITNSYDFGANKENNSQNIAYDWSSANPLASGELAYHINNVAGTNVFYQTLGTDDYPVPFSTSNIVYGIADLNCDGTPKGTISSYSNNSSDSTRDPHTTNPETGFCTVCGSIVEDWITPQADGYYHLSTVNQVEWFSGMVAAGHGAMKVKLDNDIDFGGTENAHKPIGTADKKFFGMFDGQKHHIKGMVLNKEEDGVGFFGHIQAGGRYDNVDYTETSFSNVVIEGSVTSTGARCGGLIGRLNGAQSNTALVRIECCGNEADVTAGGQNAGGLMGGIQSTTCRVIVRNCYNTGNISANIEATALVGWTGSASGENVVVKGCWNSGLVSPLDANGRNMYRSSSAITEGALCDLSTTANKQQGVVIINTENPYASGELCYLLNGDQSEISWTQNLTGEDKENMPNMYGTTSRVYQAGTVNCMGVSVGELNYNNVSGQTQQLGHNINDEIGMCDVCHTQFQEPTTDGNGYYELKNAGNVEWLSNAVANGGGAAFYAKLMNDIDFLNIENLHSPIGPATNCKFKGVFDGQGYRIKNMIINRPADNNIGFFGFLQGNSPTTVQNLIIDSSCTITGNNRIGGITGSFQNSGSTITIENVVNEATINANQDAGGIFGGREGGNPTIIIRNCVNAGEITATNSAPYAGAICCYFDANADSKIESFLNIGTVNGHRGGNMGRHNMSDITNLIDLSDTNPDGTTDGQNYGFDSGLTQADLTTGKVAYIMGFKQHIGIDTYPSPLNTAEVSYVGNASYATMYDTTTGYELNGDIKAYVAITNNTWLELIEIENVPAGTAVVLNGSYYNKFAENLPDLNIANVLQGTDADLTADGTQYILAKVDDKVGFYKATGVIPAGKAYYKNTSGVKAFYFNEENATDINEVNGQWSMANGQLIFNLAGQRIQRMQKGINIMKQGSAKVNGRKVLF